MKINIKVLAVCIAIPLIVGALSGIITSGAMDSFESLEQPPLSPPSWLFPVVWTVLFILMGLASYFVLVSKGEQKDITSAMVFYGVQLVFNFLWSIFFFNFGFLWFAFVWLAVLWILILITAAKFYGLKHTAGYLLIPYILWVSFAGYLNFAIAYLN